MRYYFKTLNRNDWPWFEIKVIFAHIAWGGWNITKHMLWFYLVERLIWNNWMINKSTQNLYNTSPFRHGFKCFKTDFNVSSTKIFLGLIL